MPGVDISDQMRERAQKKIERQVQDELAAEVQVQMLAKGGYIKRTEAEVMIEEAVAVAVAEARAEEQEAAQSARDREVTALTMAFEADAAAAKAAAEAAAVAARDEAARELAEAVAQEKEAGNERMAQAVDKAVTQTLAKERARANMTGVVKAIGHAADKKAAVDTAVAMMKKKAMLAGAMKSAAQATQAAEEAARAAEEAVRAQEAAVKQAVDATREECRVELEMAVEKAEAEAASETLLEVQRFIAEGGDDMEVDGDDDESVRHADATQRGRFVSTMKEWFEEAVGPGGLVTDLHHITALQPQCDFGNLTPTIDVLLYLYELP